MQCQLDRRLCAACALTVTPFIGVVAPGWSNSLVVVGSVRLGIMSGRAAATVADIPIAKICVPGHRCTRFGHRARSGLQRRHQSTRQSPHQSPHQRARL